MMVSINREQKSKHKVGDLVQSPYSYRVFFVLKFYVLGDFNIATVVRLEDGTYYDFYVTDLNTFFSVDEFRSECE